jgi:dienelactone hydrolase
MRSRYALLVALAAAAVAVVGAVGLARADSGITARAVTVAGVPMIEMSPSRVDGRVPGVVVAHGRAASARLMRGFADTLVARGYVVVLPDFTGHGANPAWLPAVDTGVPDVLQDDLDAAVGHLRSLPTVDPNRIALIGHSMGAAAVTRYATAHPDIAATVAISLRSVDDLPADAARPRNLLLLVGSLEMRGFRDAAVDALHRADPAAGPGTTVGDPAAGTARRAVGVPGAEHISVLYTDVAHEEAASWLDVALGRPVGDATRPRDRLVPGGLLLLAFVAGFVPLALWLLPRRAAGPGPVAVRAPYAYAGLAASLTLGVLGAGFLPTTRLPLSTGGYSAGFFALVGLGLLATARLATARLATARLATARLATARLVARPARLAAPARRLALAALVLVGYAVVAIAGPTHLAFTAAVPVGARWWLLPIVVACVGLFLAGAHRLAAGAPWRLPLILAATVGAVLVATISGLGPPFVLIVLPLLVVLLAWHVAWSLVLSRRDTPLWMSAVIGAVVVGWPIATSMPLGVG